MARYVVHARADPRSACERLGVLTIDSAGRLRLDPDHRAARQAAAEVLEEVQGLAGVDVAAAVQPGDPPGTDRRRLLRPGEPGHEPALVALLQRHYGWVLEPIA